MVLDGSPKAEERNDCSMTRLCRTFRIKVVSSQSNFILHISLVIFIQFGYFNKDIRFYGYAFFYLRDDILLILVDVTCRFIFGIRGWNGCGIYLLGGVDLCLGCGEEGK
jgi:hypothetical protein